MEIIVDTPSHRESVSAIPSEIDLCIAIAYGERELSKSVKAAGAKWDHQRSVWGLPYNVVMELGLADRVALLDIIRIYMISRTG